MTEQQLNKQRGEIAALLKSKRLELGMSQDKLAELSGMGIATIRRFESGKFWLNLKFIINYINRIYRKWKKSPLSAAARAQEQAEKAHPD